MNRPGQGDRVWIVGTAVGSWKMEPFAVFLLVMYYFRGTMEVELYLRRLELRGFKSFAEPTKIYFNSGINVVVGPSGCGKSNIIDAIRWVLGNPTFVTCAARG